MSTVLSLSITIGFLGAVATWLALDPLSGYILIWAVFIGWATFFALGGNTEALKSTMICNVFGAVCAWAAFLLVVHAPIGALTAPVWVGVTVFVLVYASQIEQLSSVPAGVLGYAATAAYTLEAGKLHAYPLTSVSFENPLIIVCISLVIGALFGALSGRLAKPLQKGM